MAFNLEGILKETAPAPTRCHTHTHAPKFKPYTCASVTVLFGQVVPLKGAFGLASWVWRDSLQASGMPDEGHCALGHSIFVDIS